MVGLLKKQCSGINNSGKRCLSKSMKNSSYCYAHLKRDESFINKVKSIQIEVDDIKKRIHDIHAEMLKNNDEQLKYQQQLSTTVHTYCFLKFLLVILNFVIASYAFVNCYKLYIMHYNVSNSQYELLY
jgi:hypothetical protein